VIELVDPYDGTRLVVSFQGSTTRPMPALPLNFRRTALVVAATTTVTVLAGARSAFHLHLVKSAPAASATVPTSPESIRLWFSQSPELAVTTVKVTGPGSAAVALAPLASGDSALVIAPVKTAMAPGSYSVAWRTMAKDGHVIRGTFSFRVEPRAR
jgi:methionine-rich copper-binding protein CopC